MKPVFISKDPQELHAALHQLWAKGVLTAQSLLSYSPVSFTCQPKFDLVFFASVRAAEFYLAQCAAPAIFGVAGSETALKIEQKFGLKAAFVVQNSGNPAQEAVAFNQWRANRSVLFPSSNLSLGTYAELIPEQQKKILPVYQTNFKQQRIAAHQVYVFSSPSNVSAFFETNDLAENAQIIAWGKSTEKALKDRGIAVTHTLLKDQQTELLQWLKAANFY
jgi:uroporphyrinogen-III synthase